MWCYRWITAAAAAALAALGPTAAGQAPDGWTRGAYGTLAFASDGKSYSFKYGSTVLNSAAHSLDNATGTTTATGTDPALGTFDVLTVSFGAGAGALSVRYFAALDAFVFHRKPLTAELPTVWPAFGIADQPPNHTRCLGWDEHYFYPGGVATDLAQCGSGGPLFLFEPPAQSPAHANEPPVGTMLLSPLSHFGTNRVVNCPHSKTPDPSTCTLGVDAAAGPAGLDSGLFQTAAVMFGRPGLVRATRAFGSIARQYHATHRSRGPGVSQLSYWNDNQAGYSWWTVGPDQSAWGKPEDIYLKLKEGYDKAGIPVRGWEPDNNWNVTYRPIKNWIGNSWNEFNESLYPSGGEGFVSKLGNLSMVYYTNGWSSTNVYQDSYNMVGSSEMEPHPNASLTFHHDVFQHAQQHYNMQMLFTDFLCYRGPSMGAYTDVPPGEDGEHMWLAGMTLAAQNLGMEVQYCMALAHQILLSLEWPAVTNARANGDGGLATESLVLTSVLASMVGLGWSKDNLRTADRCYVDAYYPNGTIMWPCGSSNHGEGTSGEFTMQVQQTILATLSLGPVGIADQLSASPYNASADITSNKTLVMGTCTADGQLLQPSYPATPVERMIVEGAGFGDCTGPNHRAYTYGCGGNVYATYTAVLASMSGAAETNLWWTAVGFSAGRGQLPTSIELYEADLAPMVDAKDMPSPDFSDVPKGSFLGSGTAFPNTSASGYVFWNSDFVNQRTCADIEVAPWNGSATMVMPSSKNSHGAGGAAMINLAPLFEGVALLGELGKVTAVSSHRFTDVSAAGGTLTVSLRGQAGESVLLAFAKSRPGTAAVGCSVRTATIGSDGAAVVKFAGDE